MSNTSGILYGLGMGPGDPGLLTLKAANILATVDTVLAAASTKNDYSLALSIARPHLRPGTPVITLGFPMTKDQAALAKAWRENAEKTLEVLSGGKSAAFCTLGDPLTFSTFAYLAREVLALAPDTPIVTVPGITAAQAAAALTGQAIAANGEAYAVVSGIGEPEKIGRILDAVDAAVILKAYRDFPAIRAMLEEKGLAENSRFFSQIGMEGERIEDDLAGITGTPPYFSLILVKK